MSSPEKKIKIDDESQIMIQFSAPESSPLPALQVPLNSKPQDLHEYLNQLLNNDPPQPYTFQHASHQITGALYMFIKKFPDFSTEHTLNITYHPQSLYFIKPITRWSSSLQGHEDAVLASQFSPNGEILLTGSGDKTVRAWDIDTETPRAVIKDFRAWVLCLSIKSTNDLALAGDSDGHVYLLELETFSIRQTRKGHKQFCSSVVWEPFKGELCLSGGKDGQVKMWDMGLNCLKVLSSHTAAVTKVIWGGQGLIYSASEDRLIKVWKENGSWIRDLKGHGHWVNTMAVHTDFVLRNGAHEMGKVNGEIKKKYRIFKYDELLGKGNERLVSGSDDFTLIMWDPKRNAKVQYRMTGHQGIVNHISFSPDGKYVISGAFDKCLKLWDGYNGTFITNFRGHVQSIYQVAWSADSRLCISGSKDSTMKVWDIKTKKLMFDLPGHSDEIYTVDWSPDGNKVVSGGKDKLVKIWKN